MPYTSVQHFPSRSLTKKQINVTSLILQLGEKVTVVLPNFSLLLGLGWRHNPGLLGTLILASGLWGTCSMTAVLWRRRREAFGTHDAWNIFLSPLSCFGDGLWDDSIGLLLFIVRKGWLHLLLLLLLLMLMMSLLHPLLWHGYVRGRWRGRRGAAFHWWAEYPRLAARTISVLRRLWERRKRKTLPSKHDIYVLHRTSFVYNCCVGRTVQETNRWVLYFRIL